VNLLISGRLSRPPSSVHCFRDVTLYANIFANLNVLITCQQHNKDRHWRFLKKHGAFDFIDDIVRPFEETGVIVSNTRPCSININHITEYNLNTIIQRLIVYTP
jgi:hypothetical protein